MPEITIFTNQNSGCDNGTAEISPFTVGDATDEWVLKFNDGSNFYAPSNVTMSVGHINGLPDGTYNDAFTWVDRADNEHVASITVTSGVPSIAFNTPPLGGVIGNSGVYLLRGPQLDGRITSIEILEKGAGLVGVDYPINLTIAPPTEGASPAQATVTLEIDPANNPGGATQLGTIDHIFYTSPDGYYLTQVPAETAYASGFPYTPSGTRSTFNPRAFEDLDDNIFIINPLSTPGGVGRSRGSKLNRDSERDKSFSSVQIFNKNTGSLSNLSPANVSYTALLSRGRCSAINLIESGIGYTVEPEVTFLENTNEPSERMYKISVPHILERSPIFRARIAYPRYNFPFKRDDSGNNILGACILSPYSDGKVEDNIEYDHSLLVVRPQIVATATLTQVGNNWEGSLNPINAYVTERLALRRSTQLDLQIYGDGRMLFQGQLPILDKII